MLFSLVQAGYFLYNGDERKREMLVDLPQPTDKLLFAGMAGGKCVTMACNNRNTIGGCSVSLPCANRCLAHWRGSALKPPLCKGRWQKSSIFAGGVVNSSILMQSRLKGQSLSQKSKIFDSSLYTREPWALPRQCVKQQFIALLTEADMHERVFPNGGKRS